MPGPGGKEFSPSYNCQAAVDSAYQVIVAADVTKQPSDHGWGPTPGEGDRRQHRHSAQRGISPERHQPMLVTTRPKL